MPSLVPVNGVIQSITTLDNNCCMQQVTIRNSDGIQNFIISPDTYVINEEQAETVRMIFNMYESGYGLQMIRDELIKRERKNSSGLVKWDNTRILRCLHNSACRIILKRMKNGQF